MARKQYGTTLWGAELLSVLERKTDSGRLGRGRSYANTGRVYDIKVDKNHIRAKVAGNYSPYYQTSMDFTPFTQKEKQAIQNILDKNPLILASIMNGKLPESFLRLLYEAKISLFDDFEMSCTCPDFWGNYACKHIAGLYYMAVDEMDKDPFVLFALKGFDLIEHYGIANEVTIKYPLSLNASQTSHVSQDAPEIIKLTDNSAFILSMLSPNPPFASIDYKEVMEEFYRKVPRDLSLQISPIQSEEIGDIERLMQNARYEFILDHRIGGSVFEISNPLFGDFAELFEDLDVKLNKNKMTISTNEIFRLFVSFEDDIGSDGYRYLFYLFRIAYLMIEARAFIPVVIEEKGGFSIAYRVLHSIPEVKKQIDTLSRTAPDIARYNKKYLDQTSATEAILSSVVSDFVVDMKFMHKKQKNNPPAITQTFFYGSKFKIKGFADENIASSIYNYFAVFDIVKSSYRYRIYIEKKRTYLMGISAVDQDDNYPLSKALKILKKMEILRFISFLSTHLPEINQLIEIDTIELHKTRLEEFLIDTSHIISNLGVEIVLPKELRELLRPKLTLKVSTTSGSKSLRSFFDLQSMLEYDWQIAIGDQTITIDEFEELVSSGKALIEFKEQFVVLSAEEAKNIFAQIKRKKKLDQYDILQASLNGEADLTKELKTYIDDLFTPKDVPIPNNLQAHLRSYQKSGLAWSINNLLNGFGTILADDMGLGKTIQAIATILYLRENNHIQNRTIIIVPTSLISNWEKELDRFAPTLSHHSYHGNKREVKDGDILITTYDIARRDIATLKKEKIDCLIIDEAQKIKNHATETSKAIRSIKSKYRIALSGTPVENNLSELWSIFDFTMPKYLKTIKDFQKRYAKDIEIKKDPEKIERLKKITSPFMLRRLKTDKDIAPDLPEKIIIDEYAVMSAQQAALYQSVVEESFRQIREAENTGALVLKLIVSLKQICNHPRNFDKTSPIDPALSGKAQLLLTLLDTILQRNEKVLIFTQYTEMGEILVQMIENALLTTPLYLRGSQSRKKRDELVEAFQNDPACKIFILSLKAGGTGLNLTAANHVIHYDLWFNPAVENQATDRAFRIGQRRNVSVYRFITKESFEEKIDKMIKAKQELSDLSVSVGENWIGKMDKDELREIFSNG